MRRNEIEAIVNAYNNLIDHPVVKLPLFGEDVEWKWISEEDYKWLKPILEGWKRVEYTIGGIVFESSETMMPTAMKDGEKVYIRSRHLNDLHDIIERLMFDYKRIKLDVLREVYE